MTRTIERTYTLTEHEIRECILYWLKSNDIVRPDYVADTDTVTWQGPGGATVRWIETDNLA